MSDEISVRYRVDLGSYNAFFGTWLKRSLFDRTNRRRFLLYTAGIGVALAFSIWSLAGEIFSDLPPLFFWIALPLTLIIAAALYAAALVFILAPILQFLWHLGRYLFSRKAEQTLTLSATGITKQSMETETAWRWPAVTACIETRKTLLLFTGRNAAMIVPKSAFASQEDTTRFVEAARHRWEDAHSIF